MSDPSGWYSCFDHQAWLPVVIYSGSPDPKMEYNKAQQSHND